MKPGACIVPVLAQGANDGSAIRVAVGTVGAGGHGNLAVAVYCGDGGVMYERTQNGTTYIVSGTRRYEVTDRGNLRWVGDVIPPEPVSWWRRLLAWLWSWLRS